MDPFKINLFNAVYHTRSEREQRRVRLSILGGSDIEAVLKPDQLFSRAPECNLSWTLKGLFCCHDEVSSQ